MDAVPEQPAQVADLLAEAFTTGEGVDLLAIDERMSAAHAHVLVHAVAIYQAYVGVVAEETGERVADVGRRPVLGEVRRPAAAAAAIAGGVPEHFVIDHVAPDPAADPEHGVAQSAFHGREGAKRPRTGSSL